MIALLALLAQVWVAILPAGVELCPRAILGGGPAAAVDEPACACCISVSTEVPEPAQHEDRCPPGCDCCITIPDDAQFFRVDPRFESDAGLLVAISALPVAVLPPAEALETAATWPTHPPDHPPPSVAVVTTVRLLI